MKKTRFLSLALTGTLCVSLLAGCGGSGDGGGAAQTQPTPAPSRRTPAPPSSWAAPAL